MATARRLKEKLNKPEDAVDILKLEDLPQDCFHSMIYQEKPDSIKAFVEQVTSADAILAVIPEYNGSAPGVFKYFVDLLPFPQSLHKIPCCFLGLSAGRFGAFRAVQHMQEVFQYRNAYVFPGKIYLPQIDQNMDETGAIKDEFLLNVYEQLLDDFIEFSQKLSSAA